MASKPNIQIRGIRQSLPSGYVLGRVSAGNGPAELISYNEIARNVVATGIIYAPGNPPAQEWNAGAVGTLGTGLSISGTTLETNWREGEVTAFSGGLSIVGTTLTTTWNGGTVSALGTGLAISGGTLNPNWQAGTVAALGAGLSIQSGNTLYPTWQVSTTVNTLGTGLSINSGTLFPTWQVNTTVNTLGPGFAINSGTLDYTAEWQAGTVSALGSGFAINSGTLNYTGGGTGTVTDVATTGSGISGGPITTTGTLSVEWNAGTVATVGAGLSLTGGTLTATGSGGSVTNVATSGSGISGGPITTTGTLSVEWNAGTVSAIGSANLAINSGTLNVVGNTSGSATAGQLGEQMSSGSPSVSSAGTTVTFTLGTPGVVNWTAHGLTGCVPVQFSTTGALPTGLSASPTTYWTIPGSITTNSFHVATSAANAFAGTAVAFTGSQSGTQTGYPFGSIPNNSATSAAAIQLTAGIWLVSGSGNHVILGGTATVLVTSLSETLNSTGNPPYGGANNTLNGSFVSGEFINVSAGVLYIAVSGTQIVYLGVFQNSGNAAGASGFIQGIRVG